MNALLARLLVVATLGTILTVPYAIGQQNPPSPYPAACGPVEANFVVKRTPTPGDPTIPPSDKALVYLIESMPNYPVITKKVNIGMDGTWLGATDTMTHISFTVDPGIHHLCAVYQGHAVDIGEEARTLLLHLDAQAGKVYYLRYHAFITRDGGTVSFQPIDEDEGIFLVQHTEQATSKLKK